MGSGNCRLFTHSGREAEPNAGFSTADLTVRPVIDSGAYSYYHLNVVAQQPDSNSLLNWTIRMIQLRKACPEIGHGNWQILETSSENVLIMQYEGLGKITGIGA